MRVLGGAASMLPKRLGLSVKTKCRCHCDVRLNRLSGIPAKRRFVAPLAECIDREARKSLRRTGDNLHTFKIGVHCEDRPCDDFALEFFLPDIRRVLGVHAIEQNRSLDFLAILSRRDLGRTRLLAVRNDVRLGCPRSALRRPH